MSDDLKAMLREQATSVAFRPADLQAVRRTGDRRIRVRRAVSAVAGAVAVALIGGSVVVLGGRSADPAPPVSPWPAEAVTWAFGPTIHVGADTVDAEHAVRAYVRTAAGFATIDDADNVYSVTAEGVRQIGHATAAPRFDSDVGDDQPRIVADPRGTLVGWVGEGPAGVLTVRTYDQATGLPRSYPAPGARSAEDVVFHAIDGRTGYWRTPSGVYAVDLDRGDERLLNAGQPPYGSELYSAADGMLAFRRGDTIQAGRFFDTAREIVRFGEEELTLVTPPTRLSPSGSWLSLGLVRLEKVAQGNVRSTSDTADVYNTSTGEHVALNVPFDAPADSTVAIPVLWLDDDTVQVFGAVADRPWDEAPTTVHVTLHRCTVPAGTCQEEADLGTVNATADALPVLPDGRGSAIE